MRDSVALVARLPGRKTTLCFLPRGSEKSEGSVADASAHPLVRPSIRPLAPPRSTARHPSHPGWPAAWLAGWPAARPAHPFLFALCSGSVRKTTLIN